MAATCPLCEHLQAGGDECQVCGHKLVGAGAEATPVEPLADLEPTLQAAVEIVSDPIPDLEPTRLETGPGSVPEARATWTESTRADPVGAVASDPVPGMEDHRAEPVPDDGPGLDPLAPVVCRYCRATAMPGDKFCVGCGMRLSRFEPVRIAALERGEMVCPDCGAMGQGPRCRRCGGRMSSMG